MGSDLHRATLDIAAVFEWLGLPSALGGAIGMGFSGVIRATRDVDILAAIPALRTQEVVDALDRAGFRGRTEAGVPAALDAAVLLREARERGHFRIWSDAGVRVEVFLPRVPLQHAILERRKAVELDGARLWVTTAEDLILLKMIFHRPKDLEDARRLLAANRDLLDAAYLCDWRERTLEPEARRELGEMMAAVGM